jgi:probable phosphoglycerate mutase
MTDGAPVTTRVVLVRHGEAECNVNGLVGGPKGCTGLTERGREQVTALRDRLFRTGELAGVAAVYSSDLARAVDTARIIEPALGHGPDGAPLRTVVDPELSELRPGDADGLSWEEFAARYGEPPWDDDPWHAVAPGGESWYAFVERAARAVVRLTDAHPGDLIVLVCHGGVVESTFLRFLPVASTVSRLGLPTQHASLTEWARTADRWVLRRYNDVTVPGEVGGER